MNVWCGIINDMLIGPVIVEDRMTGDNYLHFLQHELPEQLEDVPLDIRRGNAIPFNSFDRYANHC